MREEEEIKGEGNYKEKNVGAIVCFIPAFLPHKRSFFLWEHTKHTHTRFHHFGDIHFLETWIHRNPQCYLPNSNLSRKLSRVSMRKARPNIVAA